MDKCEIQNLKTLCYITSSILKVVYLFMGCIKSELVMSYSRKIAAAVLTDCMPAAEKKMSKRQKKAKEGKSRKIVIFCSK